ncbi:MAG: cytidine deaminase, partial [Pseudomonadota bacterium]
MDDDGDARSVCSIIPTLKQAGWAGTLDASHLAQLRLETGLSPDALLSALAKAARCFARPALSGFSVGAAVYDSAGRAHLGANLEVIASHLAMTVHAEQAAIATAIRAQNPKFGSGQPGTITTLAATETPCGHCRQFMMELAGAHQLRILIAGQEYSLDKLYPYPFGPGDLKKPALILPPACEASADFIAQITHSARYSHTPYSNQPAALGLQLKGGGSVKAGAIENAAFNPGLNPLQSALSGLALRQIGLEDGDVTRA